jgi:hypothetical protein
MSDTSGPMYEMPLAQYDPDEQCWKTSEATSLWALPMSSLTLPAWGSLRDGALFEQPTPARLTTGQDFLSLPTPVADHSRGLPQTGTDFQSLPNVAMSFLPTPRAQNGEPRNQTIYKRKGPQNLENALALLPTPQMGDGFAQNDNLNNARAHKTSPYGDLPRTVAQQLLGATTHPPLSAGSTSLDDQHQPPLFTETTATA